MVMVSLISCSLFFCGMKISLARMCTGFDNLEASKTNKR